MKIMEYEKIIDLSTGNFSEKIFLDKKIKVDYIAFNFTSSVSKTIIISICNRTGDLWRILRRANNSSRNLIFKDDWILNYNTGLQIDVTSCNTQMKLKIVGIRL